MEFVFAKNKIYPLHLGLKSLMEYDRFSYNFDIEQRDFFLFFLAITDMTPLTYEEVEGIYKELGQTKVKELIEQVLINCLGSTDLTKEEDINNQIEELYKIAVGELGIAPQSFYSLSPKEIELAYQGYLRRLEVQSALNLLSQRQATNSNATPFSFEEAAGSRISTIKDRNETFLALGI